MRLALAIAGLALLAGCGYVGPPLPPALNIPQPVKDLNAVQVGDKLLIHFTLPTLTTEEIPIAALRSVTLYAGTSEGEFSRERWAATASQYQVPVDATDFPLPVSPEWAGKHLIVSVRTTGTTGKESDFAEYQIIPVGTPLTPPTDIVFTPAPDVISLKWKGNAPRYRVLRSTADKFEPVGEVESPEYVDPSVTYGSRYTYVIVGLAGTKQESLPSASAEFTPTDIFPPTVPGSPTAVASARSVDLSWTRSADDDFAGYNIFRAVGDGPFELLEQRVPLPAYTDTRVESGKRYRYTISAVDMVGNESDRSAEAVAQVE